MEGGADKRNTWRWQLVGGRGKKLKTALAAELDGRFICGKCGIKNCHKLPPHVIFADDETGEVFKSCPVIFIKPKTRYYLMLYSHYQKGYLLYAGGVADQPRDYLQAMRIIESQINKHNEEKQ